MLEVRYHSQVKKEVKRIPVSWRRRIERVIDELAKEPEKGKRLRGKLEGVRSHRAGNYHIVYIIENKVLHILSISHRRNVYEESTRRTQ